jgi:hypothetical protein
MIWIDEARDPWSGPATIDRTAGPDLYLVRDAAGRLRRVRALTTWRAGDRVRVLEGVVVGRAGAAVGAQVFEV